MNMEHDRLDRTLISRLLESDEKREATVILPVLITEVTEIVHQYTDGFKVKLSFITVSYAHDLLSTYFETEDSN